MSSEKLGHHNNVLKGDLGGGFDILTGSTGEQTDLGIARRFSAAAAYSLRDIGAMNGRVVRVRRDSDDAEEDFSANQVASGALKTWVQDGATQEGLTQSTWQNEGSEGTFTSTSVDGFTYSNSTNSSFTGVTLSNSLALNDSIYISFNATNVTYPDSNNQSPQVRLRDGLGSGSNPSSDTNHIVNGFNAFTLTYNTGSNGNHIVFSEGDTGGESVTISDFKVFAVSRNGFVKTWYDQSGNGHDVSQSTPGNQPKIILNGGQDSQGIHFDQDQSLYRSDAGTPIQTSAFFTFVATRDENTVRPTLAGNNADIAWNTNDYFMLRANSSNTRTASNSYMVTERNREYLLSVSVDSSRVPTFYIDGNTETEPALTEDVGHTFKFVGGDTGANATYGLNGRINELIAFNGDRTNEVDYIRADQNNHYNTY